jgi:4-amino-4-deoxy-L-arabinose transferase-like glycosyltransferase
VLAVAATVRAAVPLTAFAVTGSADSFLTPDSAEYLDLARSLADGRGYSDASGPHLRRPPGYPLLLVPGVALGAPVAWAAALQAALGACTVLLVFTIARTLIGSGWALLPAILCTLDPVLVAWTPRVMAEAALTFAVALALAAALSYVVRPRAPAAVAAGLALAGAAFMKPVALVLIPVLGVALAWGVARVGRSERLRHAAALLLAGLLPLAAWQLRNARAAGYAGFSTQADGFLSLALPAGVIARTEGRPFTAVRKELDAGRDAFRRNRDGLRALAEHPVTTVVVVAEGALRTLAAPGALPLVELLGGGAVSLELSQPAVDHGAARGLAVRLAHGGPILALTLGLGLVHGAVLLLAARGALRCPAGPRTVLLAFVACFVLLSAGAWGQSRFRSAAVPALCLLAGCGIAGARGGGTGILTRLGWRRSSS